MTAKTQAALKKEFSKFLELVDQINEGHYLIARVEKNSTLAEAAFLKGKHSASVDGENLDGSDAAAKKFEIEPEKLLAFRHRIVLNPIYTPGAFNPHAVSFINEMLGQRIGRNVLSLDRMLTRSGIEVREHVQPDVRMGRGSHVIFMNTDDEDFVPKLGKVNKELEGIKSALEKKMPAKIKQEWGHSSTGQKK